MYHIETLANTLPKTTDESNFSKFNIIDFDDKTSFIVVRTRHVVHNVRKDQKDHISDESIIICGGLSRVGNPSHK